VARYRRLARPRRGSRRSTASPAPDQSPQGEISRIGKSADQAKTGLTSKSDKQNQIRLQSAQVANSARWDW
jgi:hypothetical protein